MYQQTGYKIHHAKLPQKHVVAMKKSELSVKYQYKWKSKSNNEFDSKYGPSTELLSMIFPLAKKLQPLYECKLSPAQIRGK